MVKGKKAKPPSLHPLSKSQLEHVDSLSKNGDVSPLERVTELRSELVLSMRRENSTLAQLNLCKDELKRKDDSLNKSNAVNQKLENLCRALQEQNRENREQNATLAKAQEEKTGELQLQIEKTLEDYTKKLEKYSEVEVYNKKLEEALEGMKSRIEVLSAHHEKELEAKGIEVKLAQAEAAKMKAELESERDNLRRVCEAKEKENELLHEKFIEIEKSIKENTINQDHVRSALDQKRQVESEKNELIKTANQLAELYQSEKNEREKQSSQVQALEKLCKTLKQKLDLREE